MTIKLDPTEFKRMLSPMPIRPPQVFNQIPLQQKLIDTYHFFAGYMGTLERYKKFKELKQEGFAKYRMAERFDAEMQEIEDKMHMGVFDYFFLGVFFISTKLALKPAIVSYPVDKDGNEYHQDPEYIPADAQLIHYGTITNTSETTPVTPLAVVLSGLAALPRLLFGCLFLAIATPFVCIAHGFAKFTSWLNTPKDYIILDEPNSDTSLDSGDELFEESIRSTNVKIPSSLQNTAKKADDYVEDFSIDESDDDNQPVVYSC